jgi:hypothetical protein
MGIGKAAVCVFFGVKQKRRSPNGFYAKEKTQPRLKMIVFRPAYGQDGRAPKEQIGWGRKNAIG